MNTIGKQFDDIIKPRVELALERGSEKIANAIDVQMKDNTLQGRGFKTDEYNNTYATSTKAERTRLGLQTDTVTLRRKNHRIEKTKVTYTKGTGSVIEFIEGGGNKISSATLFHYHHTGRAKGGKVRSIFPKSFESVPDNIIKLGKNAVQEVLSGSK
jgi:hypothetical protein